MRIPLCATILFTFWPAPAAASLQAIRDAILNSTNVYAPPSSPTDVWLQLRAVSVYGLDIAAQTISITGFVRQWWIDSRLVYDPALLPPNHTFVRLDAADPIWKPDTFVVNRAGDLGATAYELSNPGASEQYVIRVAPNGTVLWSQMINVKTTGPMNPHLFPFMKMLCAVAFQSYGYPDTLMRLLAMNPPIVLEQRLGSPPAFDLAFPPPEIVPAVLPSVRDGALGSFPQLVLWYTLSVKPSRVMIAIWLPCNFLVLLVAGALHLDPILDTGDRHALAITSFMAAIFFSTVLPLFAPHLPVVMWLDVFMLALYAFQAVAVCFMITLVALWRKKQRRLQLKQRPKGVVVREAPSVGAKFVKESLFRRSTRRFFSASASSASIRQRRREKVNEPLGTDRIEAYNFGDSVETTQPHLLAPATYSTLPTPTHQEPNRIGSAPPCTPIPVSGDSTPSPRSPTRLFVPLVHQPNPEGTASRIFTEGTAEAEHVLTPEEHLEVFESKMRKWNTRFAYIYLACWLLVDVAFLVWALVAYHGQAEFRYI